MTLSTFTPAASDVTVNITYTVTDSRGGTASYTFENVKLLGYSAPRITSASALRATSNGTADVQGTYANLSATAESHSTSVPMSSLVINSSTGTRIVTGTVSGKTGSASVTGQGESAYQIAAEYEFTVIATDNIGISSSFKLVLPKATVTLSLHKENGIGLGTVAEAGFVTSALPVFTNGSGWEARFGAVDSQHHGELDLAFNTDHKVHGVYSTGYSADGTTWTSGEKWLIYRGASNNVNIANVIDIGSNNAIYANGSLRVNSDGSFAQSVWADGGQVMAGIEGRAGDSYVVCRNNAGDIYFACWNGTNSNKGIGVRSSSGAYKDIVLVDQNNVATFYGKVNGLVDMVYPVGSIYMSVNSTSPATLFGGTWEQIKGRFLLGTGTPDDNSNTGWGTNLTWNGTNKYNEAVGSTGGESLHTLTVAQMPSHSHTLESWVTRSPTGGRDAFLVYGMNSGTPQSTKYYQSPEGGGQAHNNMPPYLVVYMWKRTA